MRSADINPSAGRTPMPSWEVKKLNSVVPVGSLGRSASQCVNVEASPLSRASTTRGGSEKLYTRWASSPDPRYDRFSRLGTFVSVINAARGARCSSSVCHRRTVSWVRESWIDDVPSSFQR